MRELGNLKLEKGVAPLIILWGLGSASREDRIVGYNYKLGNDTSFDLDQAEKNCPSYQD